MKTILLTGDSRGVGLSITKTLLKEGYKIVGLSRKQSEDSKQLVLKYKNQYSHIDFDLSEVSDIKELYKSKIKPLGPIYSFINNAAIAYDDIITNVNSYRLEEMFRVNVFSPILLTKYILRDMLLHKTKGNILHISSISVHTGYKGLAMYASSKGAMEAFSKNTAREWGTLGIRSNVVCPGFMDTDMSASLSDNQKSRIFNRNSRKSPLTVNEVATSVSFLVSDNANGITGQVIHVDNGTI